MHNFDIKKYTGNMRAETANFIIGMNGANLSVDEFIAAYKSLSLPKTSPAKGRNMYKFLKRVGYLN